MIASYNILLQQNNGGENSALFYVGENIVMVRNWFGENSLSIRTYSAFIKENKSLEAV